jgi:ribosomal protein S18 acetylase RimI-like enzyme
VTTAAPTGPIRIRPAEPADEGTWRELFAAYCAVGGVDPAQDGTTRVWTWLHSHAAQSRCLLATIDGRPVGFVHFRPFERPILASTGLYLDDLYVDPSARGLGIATRLIDEVRTIAADEGHDVVRWTTRESNEPAVRLYDRIAQRAGSITYDALPALRTSAT